MTVIPLPAGGFRLACNRDESRRRAPARPPIEVCFGHTWAVMPVDGDRGGTWVAATDRGLAFALLNYNPRPGAGDPPAPQSRGAIIPSLLDTPDADAALDRVTSLDAAAFGPFRLLVIGHGRYAELVSDRTVIKGCARAVPGAAAAILLTSSGLGDGLVEPPRRALFNRTLAFQPTTAAQDAFHRHRWPDRPELSVCMSRDDARTVSYTTVEVSQGCAVMRYRPLPPDDVGNAATATERCISFARAPRSGAAPA